MKLLILPVSFFLTLIFSNPGFDTEDGMPGNGQKCEEMDRPCEKYNEGRLSYQYRSGGWKPILDDCVLQVIKDLERRAKVNY